MVHEVAALLSKLTADYRSWLPLRFLSDLALQWGRWKERGGDGAFSKALEVTKKIPSGYVKIAIENDH